MGLAYRKNNALACFGSSIDEENVTFLKCDSQGSYCCVCVRMHGIIQVQKLDVINSGHFAEHQGMAISQIEKREGSIYCYRGMGT